MLKFLVILSLSLLLCQGSKSDSLADSQSYIVDEDILVELKEELESINTSNDILRLRLEALTKRPCGNKYPGTCAEAAALSRESGIYTIQVPSFSAKPFRVSCDEDEQGGGWTVIQRRVDDTIDFYRDWKSYKIGFGNLKGNFFIGLDKLYAMTTAIPQELLIVLTDFDNVTKYAKYESFAIGDESEMYPLKVLGEYSGDAGDSLIYHKGAKFSTKDKQNDKNDYSCAARFKGGWWYKACHRSNLNGIYIIGEYGTDKFGQGIEWYDWHGDYYSLKTVKMLIRPKRS